MDPSTKFYVFISSNCYYWLYVNERYKVGLSLQNKKIAVISHPSVDRLGSVLYQNMVKISCFFLYTCVSLSLQHWVRDKASLIITPTAIEYSRFSKTLAGTLSD